MSRKRLIWIIVGVVSLGVIMTVASTRQSENVAQSTSDSADGQQGGWKISTSRDPMNDSQIIEASVAADNQIQGWLDSSRPVLHVGCTGGKTRVYVWTGTPASVETDYDGGLLYGHKVILRFDDNPSFAEDWVESDDHKALFESEVSFDEPGANPAQNLIVRMVQSNGLLFKFTPLNANPVIAHFDLQGLSKHIDEITKPCGWTVE